MIRSCIAQTGVVCSIGVGTAQLSASFRAGLSGFAQSPIVRKSGQPITMALVPDDVLDALPSAFETETLSDRERRMLRLGGTALRQIAGSQLKRCPLFLALPANEPAYANAIRATFVDQLALQAGVEFDANASRCFELGRAGGLFALRAGVAAIAEGHTQVLVGGIDTYLDLRVLAGLVTERRLLGPDIKEGFAAGEAAAFLLLTRAKSGDSHTVAQAIGTAEDAGHRYSEQPALGEGLSAALDDALAKYGVEAPVRTCFSGLNGENFGSKEWGVARLRHSALFDPALVFEHPADCFGDVGAAMGPLLIALADETMKSEARPGPMLVWASSDHAPCGCAFLSANE
jgi:3-oxoacyl-[acyl-carrier-protein] synthase-1